MTNTRRAGIYCRISQDRGGAGLGVARQERDARALCDRLGWTVESVFTDNDLSAYAGRRREGYQRLLAALRRGEIDAVVAWHPDRLHRAPRELEDFIDVIERAGADVATVTAGDLDLTSATGRMTARITGAVARHESEHKSERIRRKHAELAEQGKVPGGGRRPFGYAADRLTIDDREAVHIRSAAERVLAGASLRSIVAEWNQAGVKTVTGAAWSSTTLKRLLMSGRIGGRREHHGQLVAKAEWPAIISDDQSLRLRALLSDRGRASSAVRARSYLLSGLLKCGRCEARMTTRASHVRRTSPKGREYRYRYERYVCSSDRGGCGRCGVNADKLELLITDAVQLALDSPALAQQLDRRRGGTVRTTGRHLVEELESRQVELAGAWASGDITMAEWRSARRVLEEKLDAARAALSNELQSEALPTVQDLRAMWVDASLDRRRAVLFLLIHSISIAPTTRGGNRFEPERVSVTWLV